MSNNTNSNSAFIAYWEDDDKVVEDVSSIEWNDESIQWSDITIPNIQWWEELED